eukprot:scaffold227_cov165-Amphora_coffeaeformis.AAC.37
MLSYRQQQKFFLVKGRVFDWVRQHQRHLWRTDGKNGHLHAFILNKKYAFRHILKCGGTTVLNQVQGAHVPKKKVGPRKLIATVRDPIDHFLSGWAECGKRSNGAMIETNKTYDTRIQNWLGAIRRKRPCPGNSKFCRTCGPHSYPQANYILSTNRTKLDLIGDLRELPQLLELVGFHFNHSKDKGNNAAVDSSKEHFPRRKDLLSNETTVALCKYLALDYYLFDFEYPEACQGELHLDKWLRKQPGLADC